MQQDILLCGDSLKLMQKLPDESVDLIFADPPYFMQLHKELKIIYYHYFNIIDMNEASKTCRRKCRHSKGILKQKARMRLCWISSSASGTIMCQTSRYMRSCWSSSSWTKPRPDDTWRQDWRRHESSNPPYPQTPTVNHIPPPKDGGLIGPRKAAIICYLVNFQ